MLPSASSCIHDFSRVSQHLNTARIIDRVCNLMRMGRMSHTELSKLANSTLPITAPAARIEIARRESL